MTDLKRSDFSKICRTCLLEKDDMEPIYKSEIPKMLMSFTNIKVIIDDTYPHQVCVDCTKEIFRCFRFQQQCEQNQLQLDNYLHYKNTMKIEDGLEEEHNLSKDSDEVDYSNVLSESGPDQDNANIFSNEPCENECSTKRCLRKRNGSYVPSDKASDLKNKRTDPPEDSKLTPLEDSHEIAEELINEDNPNVFSCELCSKQFSQKNYLTKHRKRHNQNKVDQKLSCHICGKLVLNLKFHIKMNHSTNKPFKCSECDQSFPLNCVLARHVKFHHRGEKRKTIPRLCTLCGKTVHSSTALKYHMRVHSAENPFGCDVCQKKFNSSGHLIVHKRTHSGERPYKCSTCEKCFSTSNILKKHIRTHTGERPYKCRICAKAFTQGCVLKTHMNVHKLF